MEHRRSKLALFFVVQALAVGAMIFLLRRSDCPRCEPVPPSAASVIVTALVILGELCILAQGLRADGPVWRTVLALGILALIAAPFAVLFAKAANVARTVVGVAVGW